jgi:hypothetical protein
MAPEGEKENKDFTPRFTNALTNSVLKLRPKPGESRAITAKTKGTARHD